MSTDATVCAFPGCGRPRRGKKTYCASHAKQLSLHGTVSKFISRRWTDEETQNLQAWYKDRRRQKIDLAELERVTGRNRHVICRKAKELGLTDGKRKRGGTKLRSKKYKTDRERREALSRFRKDHIATHGHPRGALGMKHSDETRKKISLAGLAAAKRVTKSQRRERAMKALKTKVANGNSLAPQTASASWKAGWREIGGQKVYFRSAWEANYARFLELERARGEVVKWEHEPETFWFDKIRRGVTSYLPDFRVTFRSGRVEYHEVKGWMDPKSKTKIQRMKKYYPEIKLIVINAKIYHKLSQLFSRAVPGWE